MDNKIILESLASDLKRISLGIQRGSFSMARRFSQEALARKAEIDCNYVDGYVIKLLNRMEMSLKNLASDRVSEDILMCSVILQNYCLKKLS